MKMRYEATAVPVLRFHYDPDSEGYVLPPECYCMDLKDGPVEVPVLYAGDERKPIGTATIHRQGRWIMANFKLESVMTPVSSAIELMRKLTPAAGFEVREFHAKIITMIKIRHIILTPHGNEDSKVRPIGAKLRCLSTEALN